MRAPSKKRLLEAFPDCDPDKVLAIIHGTLDPETVPATADWVRQCYHRPRVHELKMHALNVLLEGHGVEGISTRSGRGIASYVNMGDTYNATILHHKDYVITTWGDFVETYERRHGEVF